MMFKFYRRLKEALSSPEIGRADLISLLEELSPKHSYEERIFTLVRIVEWLRLPVKTTSTAVPEFIQSRNVRLRFLMQVLERNPEMGENLAQVIREFTLPGDAVGLYCLLGMSENTGFFNELTNRLVEKLFPDTFTEKDLSETFRVLFTEDEDAQWIEHSYKEIFPIFKSFADKHDISLKALDEDRHPAMIVLGAQAAALGTTRDIRSRVSDQRISSSSFIRLNAAINSNATSAEILQEVAACRQKLEVVRQNIELSGVSVDLIFKLEKIDSILNRIEMLIMLDPSQNEEVGLEVTSRLLGNLIREEIKSYGVRDYLYENLHLLTRKIVERSGEKGVLYIADGTEERKHLFIAASWAGVLTAFTALFKYFIGIQQLPLFFEGFFFFVNYAIGFLLMQKWHLALSSKQPAYTASALSRHFESFKQTRQLGDIIQEVKKVASSQALASWANLLWVVPVVVALDWGWYFYSGSHFMNEAQAMDVIKKHHPLQSFTLIYAGLTGIFLWLSSVVAGWVENWMVFRSVPEAIRSSTFLKQILGEEKTQFVSRSFAATMGGIAGNLSIAFFLAAPIILGKFLGLPLDIRHVTLAAGTVSLAFNALEWNVMAYWHLLIWMVVSISAIGVLNFGVSFYFSIRMAAVAREVDSRYLKIIFKFALRRRRLKSPE